MLDLLLDPIIPFDSSSILVIDSWSLGHGLLRYPSFKILIRGKITCRRSFSCLPLLFFLGKQLTTINWIVIKFGVDAIHTRGNLEILQLFGVSKTWDIANLLITSHCMKLWKVQTLVVDKVAIFWSYKITLYLRPLQALKWMMKNLSSVIANHIEEVVAINNPEVNSVPASTRHGCKKISICECNMV